MDEVKRNKWQWSHHSLSRRTAWIKDILAAAPQCCAYSSSRRLHRTQTTPSKRWRIAQTASLRFPFNKQRPTFCPTVNFHRACTELRTAHSAFSTFTLLLFWLLQVIAVINLGKLALVMDSRRGLGVKQWWAMETVVSKESSCNPLTGVDKMGGRKRPNVWRPSDGSILGEGWRQRRGNPAERLSSSTCGFDCWRSSESSAGEQEGWRWIACTVAPLTPKTSF